MTKVRLVSGLVGSGFPEESLSRALDWGPDVIACQGTSADPGPYYHATDVNYLQSATFSRDLRLVLLAAKSKGIPFVGSLGGAGNNAQLEKSLRLVDEIAREHGRLRVAVIRGELAKDRLQELVASGVRIPRVVPHPRLSEFLTLDDLTAAGPVVAQMGAEPIMAALESGADAVLTGRAVDVCVLAAYPMKRGVRAGSAMFAGKIMECMSAAAEPSTPADLLCGEITDDYFDVFPPNHELRCTPMSVASHSIYEREEADFEVNPGGILYVDDATYTPLDDRTVRVAGGRWEPAPYTVKIEAAALVGYRSICLAGIRDDVTIANLDTVIEMVMEASTWAGSVAGVPESDYTVTIHPYGRNGILGDAEPSTQVPHEVLLLIDVVASSQELARSICTYLKTTVAHVSFDGIRTTAGNVAFPFSPAEHDVGPAYRFNIWHSLPLADPLELFPYELTDFPRRSP